MPDPARIDARLQALWEIAHGPGGGADRPAYSAAEAQAMTLIAGWARELQLLPAVDPHGNLWALPEGDGPIVTAGSHVDTVPDGGRYDGALGTVLGLELVADLQNGTDLAGAARPGLLVCAAEEAPRFGAGTVGSRLLAGALGPEALAGLHDSDGVSAAAARADFLAALDGLARLARAPVERLRAHVEIHVALRFGPAELGVVGRVAAPRRLEITVTGESGHAGEVAMEHRRDALAAAAEMVVAIEAAATARSRETVATTGTLTVAPGAVSVIPGEVRLGIDMRAVERDALAGLQAAVDAAVAQIAARRGVAVHTVVTRAGEPVAMDSGLVRRALRSARDRGIPAAETWSGAGHDAQHIGGLAPSLLLFVPLHGGQSHTPQEGAEMDEILWSAAVAADVLRGVSPHLG